MNQSKLSNLTYTYSAWITIILLKDKMGRPNLGYGMLMLKRHLI